MALFALCCLDSTLILQISFGKSEDRSGCTYVQIDLSLYWPVMPERWALQANNRHCHFHCLCVFPGLKVQYIALAKELAEITLNKRAVWSVLAVG